MHRTQRLALGLAFAAISAATASAAEITIDDLDLGEHYLGPEVTVDALRGKVVLFEIWGS